MTRGGFGLIHHHKSALSAARKKMTPPTSCQEYVSQKVGGISPWGGSKGGNPWLSGAPARETHTLMSQPPRAPQAIAAADLVKAVGRNQIILSSVRAASRKSFGGPAQKIRRC